MAWKWVVLALHGALYGFAICASRGTDYSNVMTPKNKKGITKLIPFDDALKRCQDSQIMHMLKTSKNLELTDNQKESIRQLKKKFRNKFEHYQPCAWSIEIHELPYMAINILDVIEFLATKTGNYVHLSAAQQTKLKSYIYQSKRILKKHKLYKSVEETKIPK